MPTFDFTSPEGKSYSVTGPSGATKEQAYGILQQQIASGQAKPQEKPVAKQPPAPPETLGHSLEHGAHQLGLVARYTAETLASPVSGLIDLALTPMNAVIAAHGGSYQATTATEAVHKGLTAIGLPLPKNDAERAVAHDAEVAPLLVGGIALGAAGAKAALPLAKKGTDLLFGKAVKDAAKAAASEVGVVAKAAAKTAEKSGLKAIAEQRHAEIKANLATIQQSKLAAALQKQEKLPPSHGDNGKVLRESVETAMATASRYRSAQGDILFKAAEKAADVRAAKGEFVNTDAAFKPVDELLAHVRGIPGLSDKAEQMAKMLRPSRHKEGSVLLLNKHGVPLVMDEGKSAPLTFKDAEYVRRYLNDIAYSADLEGFPGIARRAAREAVDGLDKSMAQYVPEFKAYKEGWAKLSQPLNGMGTKFGKAVFDGEGGIKSDAYRKVADEALPAKFFKNSEGVKMLTESLAGGTGATPAAMRRAKTLVDKMAENYFKESTRGKAPDAALTHMQAPGQRDVAGQFPKLMKTFDAKAKASGVKLTEIGRQKALEKANIDIAREAKTRAVAQIKLRNSLNSALLKADTSASLGSKAAQDQAIREYMGVLEKAHASGGLSDDKYKAMRVMLDTTTSRLELMHKVQGYAKTAALLVMGYSGYRALGHLF